jgi:magnesium-transporting ATPase (P-type)
MNFSLVSAAASLWKKPGPSAAERETPFWLQPPEDQLRALNSRREGLTSKESATRLKQFGPNAFHEPVKQRLLTKTAKRILNPLVAILLVAAAISSISGDFGSFAIIVAVIAIFDHARYRARA